MDDLPPLLNERPRDLGPRPVGTPYVVGAVMMFVTAAIVGLHAYLAGRANAAQGRAGEGGPGFALPGIFFYFAMGVGMLAGSFVARAAALVLMGVLAAMLAAHAVNDNGLPPRAEILTVWPAPARTTA